MIESPRQDDELPFNQRTIELTPHPASTINALEKWRQRMLEVDKHMNTLFHALPVSELCKTEFDNAFSSLNSMLLDMNEEILRQPCTSLDDIGIKVKVEDYCCRRFEEDQPTIRDRIAADIRILANQPVSEQRVRDDGEIYTDALLESALWLNDNLDASGSAAWSGVSDAFDELYRRVMVAPANSTEVAFAQVVSIELATDSMIANEPISEEHTLKTLNEIQATLYSVMSFLRSRLPYSAAREALINYAMSKHLVPRGAPFFAKECADHLLRHARGQDRAPTPVAAEMHNQNFSVAAE